MTIVTIHCNGDDGDNDGDNIDNSDNSGDGFPLDLLYAETLIVTMGTMAALMTMMPAGTISAMMKIEKMVTIFLQLAQQLLQTKTKPTAKEIADKTWL